jgi:hypothetical protein
MRDPQNGTTPTTEEGKMPTTHHYVAELNIKKVERTEPDRQPTMRGGQIPDAQPRTDRVVDDLAKVVIKADSLEKLIERIGRHITIIEEG